MPFIDQLVDSIDARLRELSGEIASLEGARAALAANGGAPAPAIKPVARRSARPTRARMIKPLAAENAERLLAEDGGLTAAALARRAGADRDQVLGLLRELERARRARRTGRGRGTRWHLMSEEDWVQERAAELARRAGHSGK